MNILVTGGMGYVGSMLVKRLLELNHTVYVVDIGIYNTKLKLDNPQLIMYKEDIRWIKWEKIFRNHIDIVYHLAGISNDPGYGVSDEIGYQINFKATIRLYDECYKYNVQKFVFASSCSVYGRQEGIVTELKEEDNVQPLTNYASLKYRVEEYMRSKKTTSYVIIRPATIYGYSYRQRFDLIVNKLLLDILKNNEIHIRNVNDIRPSLYIADMIDIYISLLNNLEIDNQIYNLATCNMTIREIHNMIAYRFNKESRIVDYNETGSRSYRVSSDKILKDFKGFRFTTYETGLCLLASKIESGIFDDYKSNTNYYGNLRQPLYFGEKDNVGKL